ncbi:MAG: cysteine hydrolase [Candidatus Eisenbacteria bacterium]|nr:cysteine hydrolase [Candidatus Eisenbacteria bacterium]
MKTSFVLIVIDMQVDFFERVPALAAQRALLVAAINELVADFRRASLPVFWVRQEFSADLSDAFLDMRRHNTAITVAGTNGCEILPELDKRAGEHVIVKKRYSAFFGTGWRTLAPFLAGDPRPRGDSTRMPAFGRRRLMRINGTTT